jgi:hypothetical protein
MSLDSEDAPPPPYSESQTQSFPSGQSQPQSSNRQSDPFSSSPDAKLTIQATDGARLVTARLHIFNDPGVLPEHREMYIKLEGSTSKAYHVNFPSRSRTMAVMHVHRGDQTGPIVGQVSFLAKESHIEIGFPDGESVRIEDVNPNTRRVAVRLLVGGVAQTFYWASTENYEHKYKGKGPVGDVELVDEAGRVYGVFLNEWGESGSKDKMRVGQLNLLEPIIEDGLVDQWIVTLLALIERYVIVSSVKSGKIAEVAAGAAAATVAFCVVS